MFTSRPRTNRRFAAVLLAGALLVLPAASAAAAPAAAPDARSGNGTTVRHDVTFVAMMVPHHQAAVDMAAVAEQRATMPEVRQFAARVRQAQTDQIAGMRAWLARHHAAPMQQPAAVQAMMEQDLMMLRMAEVAHVDMMFLMMMRAHHAQAVAEADDELGNGRDRFALGLARSVRDTQTSEIAEMNGLLETLHQQNPGMM